MKHFSTQRGVFLCLLLSFFSILEAFSQTGYDNQILPVGGVEALMANTGTAGLNSVGAIYYNPAALTQLEGNSLKVSGATYTGYRFKATPLFEAEGANLDYEGSSSTSTPTTMVGVRSWKRWRIGTSIIIPLQFEYDGPESWNVSVGGVPKKFSINQVYKESLFQVGLAAATKLDTNWSIGASVNFQGYSSLSFVEGRTTDPADPTFLFEEVTREKYTPYHLLFVASAHRRCKKWDIGVRITLPNLYLFGNGSTSDFNYQNLSDGNPAVNTEVSRSSEKAVFRTPADFRLGLAYRLTEKWRFTTDNSYTMGISYDVFPDSQFDDIQERNAIWRSTLGIQHQLSERSMLHVGTAYSLPISSQYSKDNNYKFWTGTLGVKYKFAFLDNMLGVFYSRGQNDIDQGTFVSKITYENYGLFFGTSYNF